MRILKSGTFENLFKIADVRFTPEEIAQMRGEGMYVATDPDIAETNVMQGVGNRKRDIQALGVHVALPRIIFPDESHVVELDGRQYYVVHIANPQPKKNPEGTVYLMDLETGEPSRKPFMQVADRLQSVRRESFKKSIEEINNFISRWNERIGKIDSVASPTTWPMQILWATNVVEDRMNELNNQEQAFVAKLEQSTNFSPSWSATIERLKQDVMSGNIPQSDIIDTILAIQHSDPDSIPVILESPNVPENIKNIIRELIRYRTDAAAASKAKNESEEESRKERFEAEPEDEEIEGMLSPGGQELINLKEQDLDELAGRKSKTPDKYFSPGGKTSQIRATLIKIRRSKQELEEVKADLDGLRGFIGGLEKGERAKDLLMNTQRGSEIKRSIAEFIHKAKGFIRLYKTPVFVKDEIGNYGVNPALIGKTGGTGNAKVVIALNHLIGVLTNGLKAHAGTGGMTDSQNANVENLLDGSYELLPQDMP